MGYRLVLFDFDGTLADTFPWVMDIMDHLVERFDLPRPQDSEIEAMRGLDAKEIFKHYRISLWKLGAITRYVRELMARDVHRLALFPGVAESLRALLGWGTRLGVVSSNARANVEHVLGAEIARRIDYYECGVSIFGKPPKLRKVLRSSGIPAGETIYIGDETRDAEAARSTGMHFGAVTWGYARLEALLAYAPEVVFHQADELAGRLRSC